MIRENRCEYLAFISVLYSSFSLSNIANFFVELRRNSLKLSKSKVETKFQKTVVGLKHPVRSEQNGFERAPSEIRGFHRWKLALRMEKRNSVRVDA